MKTALRRSVGIDWATISLPKDSPLIDQARFELHASQTARKDHSDESRKRFGWKGYFGWTQGRIRFGQRYDGSLVIASGGTAKSLCDCLDTSGVHVSRLDIAVTAWMEGDHTSLAETLAAAASIARDQGLMHPKTKITFVKGFGGGDTVYIGSRTSDRMLRVYDKWRESGDDGYKFAWRYELELKNDMATLSFDEWRKGGRSDRFLEGIVATYMQNRGLASFRHMGYWGNRSSLVSIEYFNE